MFKLYYKIMGTVVVLMIGLAVLTYGFQFMTAPSDSKVFGGLLLIVSDVFLAAYLIGKILQGGVKEVE